MRSINALTAGTLAAVLFPSLVSAQAKPDLLRVVQQDFQGIQRSLKVKISGPTTEMSGLSFYSGSFVYPGVSHASFMVTRKAGKLTSAKIGLYSNKKLGAKGFMKVAGIPSAGWVPTEPGSVWLKNRKYPKIHLKFNQAPNQFINFQTEAGGSPWGMEIARDPFHRS